MRDDFADYEAYAKSEIEIANFMLQGTSDTFERNKIHNTIAALRANTQRRKLELDQEEVKVNKKRWRIGVLYGDEDDCEGETPGSASGLQATA